MVFRDSLGQLTLFVLEFPLSLSVGLTESVGCWLVSGGGHLATVGEVGIEELSSLSSCIESDLKPLSH